MGQRHRSDHIRLFANERVGLLGIAFGRAYRKVIVIRGDAFQGDV